jgi:hypothetical protein
MGVRVFQKSRTIARIAGVLGVLATAGLVLSLLERVRTGRGLQPYMTVSGHEANAVQALATMGFVAFVLVGYRVVTVIRRRRS